MGWTKLQRVLKDLRDDQSAYYMTSGEDSKSAGSWRTGLKDMEG